MPIFDTSLILTFLTGILYLPVLALVLGKHTRSDRGFPLVVTFLSACLIWTVSFLLPLSPSIPELGLLALAVIVFQLTRIFLLLPGPVRAYWFTGAAWFLGSVLFAVPWPDAPAWMQPAWRGLVIAGWVFFTAGAGWLAVRTYQRTLHPLHKNRTIYWWLALAPFTAGGILTYVQVPAAGAFFTFLAAVISSRIILIHQLPDLRQAARKVVVASTGFLLAVGLYGVLFWLAQVSLAQWLDGRQMLFALALAVILVAVLNPLLAFTRRRLAGWLSGDVYHPEQILSVYTARISQTLDLHVLAHTITILLTEMFAARQVRLFLRTESPSTAESLDLENLQLHLQEITPIGPFSDGSCPYSGPVARRFLGGEILTQYDIDLLPEFQGLPSDEREWLEALGMDLYVPILCQNELTGLLALGPKESGDRYFEQDLDLLHTLATQTGVALANARLYEDLKVRSLEIEHLNRELSNANRELARLDQAKSDFISIASHELRTPLTQIRGYNDILSEMITEGGMQPEFGLDLTKKVRKGTLKLEEIVNTMFDVSRLDSQTLSLDMYSTTVSSIVRLAANDWESALQIRRQTLRITDLDALPEIHADSKRLKQVFSNLIQNAIKFTQDGGQITICGRILDNWDGRSGQAIDVTVSDNGIGIASDDIEHIFEKFYRAGNSLLHSSGDIKFKGGGPGLGLAVAKGIIEAHGGAIWVESPGYDEQTCPGSSFHVLLPVQGKRAPVLSRIPAGSVTAGKNGN